MIRYRYDYLALDAAALQNHVPGLPTVGVVTTPTTIDVTVDPSSKQDLDDYLLPKGWAYVGTVDYP